MFFYEPMSHFGIRELSRQTHLDTKTTMKYLVHFAHRGVILKRKPAGSFPYYEANRLSHIYQYEKSHLLIRKIIESGIIIFLEKELSPKVIVLFGSVKKGTYHKKSDVDIFIQRRYKRINLLKFEKKIGHKMRLLFEKDMKLLNKGLLENIYNGEVLSGKLEIL